MNIRKLIIYALTLPLLDFGSFVIGGVGTAIKASAAGIIGAPCYAKFVQPVPVGADPSTTPAPDVTAPDWVRRQLNFNIDTNGCLVTYDDTAVWSVPGQTPQFAQPAIAYTRDRSVTTFHIAARSTCTTATVDVLGWYPSATASATALLLRGVAPGSCNLIIGDTATPY